PTRRSSDLYATHSHTDLGYALTLLYKRVLVAYTSVQSQHHLCQAKNYSFLRVNRQCGAVLPEHGHQWLAELSQGLLPTLPAHNLLVILCCRQSAAYLPVTTKQNLAADAGNSPYDIPAELHSAPLLPAPLQLSCALIKPHPSCLIVCQPRAMLASIVSLDLPLAGQPRRAVESLRPKTHCLLAFQREYH